MCVTHYISFRVQRYFGFLRPSQEPYSLVLLRGKYMECGSNWPSMALLKNGYK